jgi:ATP-binding cassette subfamily F protein 3
MDRGRIDVYPGDWDEYAEWKRRRAAEVEAAAPAAATEDVRAERKETKRREAEERNRRYRERREFEQRLGPLEQEIAALEERRREIDASLADPAVYRDPARAKETGRSKVEVEARLEALYRAWVEAADTTP